ncbi:hypothetical protein Tco_0514193 [Tanacetum coccineum]
MAERTMEELLWAPTKGYGEAIVYKKSMRYHSLEIKTNLLHGSSESIFVVRVKIQCYINSRVVERETKETTDKEQSNFQGSTAQIPPPVISISIPEPDIPKTLPKTSLIPESDILKSLPKPNIPYPSRRVDHSPVTKIRINGEDILNLSRMCASTLVWQMHFFLMQDFSTIKSFLMNKQKVALDTVIIKGLKDDENEALLKVLKSHKRAIAWKITDIKGIDPRFCTHKILMEDDYKPMVQSQRWVNPKIHEVIKKEVLKLLDAGMIYPISDSPWVSPVHCVPKKGGITVVANEENELIPTRLVTGWRVCIDNRKLNEATRKDHFPLLFMDQMLERLAGN